MNVRQQICDLQVDSLKLLCHSGRRIRLGREELKTLQLPLQQIPNHLATCHSRRRPQSREVQSR